MKFSIALLIGLLSLMTCLAGSSAWNKTDVDILKEALLTGYDKNTRPAPSKEKTDCFVTMTLINTNLDETRSILTSHAWLKMNWSDPKLAWDNGTYGINELRITADEIWQPDLTVYNSAEPNIVDHFAKTNKIAYYSGMVLWVPTAKFETYCYMDLKFWPFDVQKCSIKIGSWTFSGYQLDLQTDIANAIDLSYYNTDSEMRVLKTSVERNVKYYPCCVEPYIDITFNLVLQRASPMFKAIAVTPAIVIVFMTLVSFWLPPQAGEKLLLNGFAAIVICILLVYISQLLPMQNTHTPLLVTFYSHTLYLLCISFIISVIVINMSRNRKQYAVPHSIKANILDGFIGKALGGAQAKHEKAAEELDETPFEEQRQSDNHQIIADAKPHQFQADWIRLATVVDRLTFGVYVFVFIGMGFLHLV